MDKSTIIAKLREHEVELRSAGIEHLSLFGSWARGTAVQARSDIDLIAEFDSGREHSLLDRLENRLADMLGAKVERDGSIARPMCGDGRILDGRTGHIHRRWLPGGVN